MVVARHGPPAQPPPRRGTATLRPRRLPACAAALALAAGLAGCAPQGRQQPIVDLNGLWTHPATAAGAQSTIAVYQEGDRVRMVGCWDPFQGKALAC